MCRILPLLFGLVALLLSAASVAAPRDLAVSKQGNNSAEQRIALIIGNASYTSSPLKNPVNDARAMSKKLKSLGFDVILKENITVKQIGRTIGEFRSRLRPGAVALFFYAGHGLQFKGSNYLPAVDADILSEFDVPQQSFELSKILEMLEEAKTGMNLVFLDACRNNPFARGFRSTGSGLARVSAPSGTLISYATRPGSVAADGDGSNGLYTTHLLQQMDEAGLPIESVLKRVVTGVKRDSRGMQEPWMEGSIEGEFFFATGRDNEEEKKAAERAEAVRLAAIQREREKQLEEQREEERRIAAQREADRLAAEKREVDRLAAEKREADRLTAEKREAERIAAEKRETERLAAEKREAERKAVEQREIERLAAEKRESERIAAEKKESERIAADRKEAERVAREKVSAEPKAKLPSASARNGNDSIRLASISPSLSASNKEISNGDASLPENLRGLLGTWRVTVENEARGPLQLHIYNVQQTENGKSTFVAAWGWVNGDTGFINGSIGVVNGKLNITFLTPEKYEFVLEQIEEGAFKGKVSAVIFSLDVDMKKMPTILVNEANGVFAEEDKDYGTQQKSIPAYIAVKTATPISISGGKVIKTGDLKRLIETESPLVIDVWRATGQRMVLPNAIAAGDEIGEGRDYAIAKERIDSLLSKLSSGEKSRPVVFYCYGIYCWNSYFAALRAIALGYKNVYWYRGGFRSWVNATLPYDVATQYTW